MSHHHNHHKHHQQQGPYEETPGYGYGAPPPQSDAYGYGAAPPAYGYGQEGSYAPAQSFYGYNQVIPYGGQSSNGYGGYGASEISTYQGGYDASGALHQQEQKYKKQEHMAEMGAAAAGAFALYERHEEKMDPAHAHRHHVEAEAGEAAAVGLGGYALYEHHEVNKYHKAQQQNSQGGHHHGHHHKQLF